MMFLMIFFNEPIDVYDFIKQIFYFVRKIVFVHRGKVQ